MTNDAIPRQLAADLPRGHAGDVEAGHGDPGAHEVDDDVANIWFATPFDSSLRSRLRNPRGVRLPAQVEYPS